MATFVSESLQTSIDRPWQEVYKYASRAENLPQWAAGLANSEVQKSGDQWVCTSPNGQQVLVKFVPDNFLGVMDHEVTLPSGEVDYNPFRVVPNGSGSEVIFTLYQRRAAEEFSEDKAWVRQDLKRLKQILESG